ncbi:MAG: hypothetical protein R3B95_05800 [Nitrospirales bacterium]|nr:hypothetical protein [Nitrospirales bacterium]
MISEPLWTTPETVKLLKAAVYAEIISPPFRSKIGGRQYDPIPMFRYEGKESGKKY